eukprot:TRINITY_DN5520_c0_g1_i4.p1 TRINITY_DN5520_c0_g1~~TRINITY_DN5520_c0_g1_i4.p1  ORF type:complete len:436 (-),score=51.91 TRINITY_DN5520_c0_g1_i4:427-1734(-)
MHNQKAAVSQAENEKFKKKLNELLKKTENSRCADCGAPKPNWASANLGVFICLTCSGIHRSLGVHISQVRSTSLDTWTRQQMQFIQHMDNVKANSYWEKNLPSTFIRPNPANRIQLENFIRAKYEYKKFSDPTIPTPNLSNFASHPWFQQSSAPTQGVTNTSITTSIEPPSHTPPPTPPVPQPTVSFDLLSMDGPTPTPASTATVSNPAPADDPFGDFVLPNQTGGRSAGGDLLQDPFQASNGSFPVDSQDPHHHKSLSSPANNGVDELSGLDFGQFTPPTPSQGETATNNNVSSTNTSNVSKLSANDIMSLYDQKGASNNKVTYDDNFFVDPAYVKQQQLMQLQQQQRLQQQTGMGVGVGVGLGIHHAQSAPNLHAQSYPQVQYPYPQSQVMQHQQQYNVGLYSQHGQQNAMNQAVGVQQPQNAQNGQFQHQFF